jgi:hypothetical protein
MIVFPCPYRWSVAQCLALVHPWENHYFALKKRGDGANDVPLLRRHHGGFWSSPRTNRQLCRSTNAPAFRLISRPNWRI